MGLVERFVVMHIEVVVGLGPRRTWGMKLDLAEGSRLRDALDASGVWSLPDAGISLESIHCGQWTVGVWGRKAPLDQPLRDRDRVELVRRLIVDPKEARRVRYRAQGEKLPKGFHRPKPK